MFYIITKGADGKFIVLRRLRHNPFYNLPRNEIASLLREKYGPGWYRCYRYESKFRTTTIFKGVV